MALLSSSPSSSVRGKSRLSEKKTPAGLSTAGATLTGERKSGSSSFTSGCNTIVTKGSKYLSDPKVRRTKGLLAIGLARTYDSRREDGGLSPPCKARSSAMLYLQEHLGYAP